MVKARKFMLLILAAAFFTLLLLVGCSRETAPQGYISNVCYILNENDFYEFQTKYPTTATEKEKEEYSVPYLEELTAGESYYIVGYTYAKTADESAVQFQDNRGFTIKADKEIGDVLEVVDSGCVSIGGARATVTKETVEDDDGKRLFYNVSPTATEGIAEFISYVKVEIKSEATVNIDYQVVASQYIGSRGSPVFDTANTVSEGYAKTYYSKKIEISLITARYLESHNYIDGRYNSDNLVKSVDMKVGKVYYMVIVANVLSKIETSENDTFTLEIKLPRTVLDGTLEMAGSGNFSETVSDTEKSIKVTMKIPEAVEGVKKLECIIKLVPVALGNPSAGIAFSADKVSILGEGKNGLTENVIINGEEMTSEGFEYTLSTDKTYYILENVGAAGGSSFLIPSEYNGTPVKKIAENAFRNQKNLRTVEVSEGIEEIGQNAFRGCTNLIMAKLPSSAKVGNYAFCDCNLLGSLTANFNGVLLRNLFGGSADSIPTALKTVTVVGSTGLVANAFANASWVENISLPKTLVTVGEGAFTGCSSLASLTLDSENQALFVECGVIYDKTALTPLGWVGKFPSVMTYPEGITLVPGGDMSSVTNIAVPSSATGFIGSVSNLAPDGAEGPKFLFSYVDKTNLSFAKITGDGGMPVFSGAKKLNIVSLPDNLESIPYNAFSGCEKLRTVYISGGSMVVGTVNIPSGVTSIGGAAFEGCVLFAEVNLPSGIEEIGARTFKGCTGLKAVKIPSGVTVIGERAFEGCTALTSVTMPDRLTDMGWYAFMDCKSLTAIDIPEGGLYVKPYVFKNCESLASVEIPNGVESICEETFMGCKKLTSVNLPDSVRIIDPRAFAGSGLTSITIPAAVTTLSTSAFNGCNALKSITVDSANTVFNSKNGVVYYTENNSVWITPEGKNK